MSVDPVHPVTEAGSISWLEVTEFLDHDDPAVQRFAFDTVGSTPDPTDRAIKLFYAVRDGWWYDPYSSDRNRESFRASAVVGVDRSWCVPKSVLLTASARAVGVPARSGFADVYGESPGDAAGDTAFERDPNQEVRSDGRA